MTIRYLFLIFLFLSAATLAAQTIDQKINRLEAYNESIPQEKQYIHTDRALYSAGETIWYKVYTTVGIQNRLSLLSNVGRVQLIDANEKVVADQLIPLDIGIGTGSMELADTLTEGTFRMRTYTNWMRNFGDNYYYEKEIKITNGRTDNTMTTSELVKQENATYYRIKIQSLGGIPLANTSIKYSFVENGESVQRGSEKTNDQGIINIRVNDKNRDKKLNLNFTNVDNRLIKKVINTQAFSLNHSVQLLPEGGSLLVGQVNNVGIKSLRPDGLGIKAKVEIFDDASQVVASSETNYLGIGTLNFYPSEGQNYTVNATFADGSQKKIDLPEIVSSGFSLATNNRLSDKAFIQLNVSSDKVNDQDYFIVVQHFGQIFYIAKQKLNKQSIVFTIKKDLIPNGVVTISILDDKFIPIIERPMFFSKSENSLSINPRLNNMSSTSREKVSVNVQVGNDADTVKTATLSAAVINLAKTADTADMQSNILSALLLEADIQGHIENPGYYFNKDGSVNTEELDKLLLTQGWRKINWQKIDSLDTIPKYRPEKALSIEGQIRKLGRKAPAPNASVQLISATNFMDYIDTVSNENGDFRFDQLVFPDTAKFLLSSKDEKGKANLDIIVKQDTFPSVTRLESADNDLNRRYLSDLKNTRLFLGQLAEKGLLENIIDIDEVVVTRKEKKVPDHSRNLNGPGNADQVLTSEDLETCPTLSLCLQGRLMGVVFQGDIPYNTRGMVPMQVVLDGMFVEADMLNTITPMDVASIEVLRNVNYTAMYGSQGGNGVIVITTKIGSEGRTNVQPKGILVLQPKGFSISKEFYKPIYEADSTAGFNQDLRTTIHWEPRITADKNGTANFDFYTSDEGGTYRLIIEGIDVNGRIGRKVVDFDVGK